MIRRQHMLGKILCICSVPLAISLAILPSISKAEKGDRLVPANPIGGPAGRQNNQPADRWKTDLENKKPAQPPIEPAPTFQRQQPNPANAPAWAPTPQPPLAAPTPTRKQMPAAQTPAPPPMSPEEQKKAAIGKINNFFNSITYLEGRFLQTDSGNNKIQGNFFVKRPGRIRFDYDPPSNLRIVSDGKWLSIEDHDLSTFDRYPLETTPFKLLLKRNVDLLNDADILDFFQGDDLIIITVVDKTERDGGKIKLFFSRPNIELKEWIITDPQGLDTRVELKNVIAGKRIKPGFFIVTDETQSLFQN